MESAYLVHQTGMRLRLRVPARRHDAAWFEAAAAALRQQHGITAVRSCSAAGSLTLSLAPVPTHAGSAPDLALADAGIRLATCTAPPRATPSAPRGQRLAVLPQPTPMPTSLRADRRTLALGLFLLLLARHLARSGWLAPGLALAWYLWESFPLLRRGFPRRS